MGDYLSVHRLRNLLSWREADQRDPVDAVIPTTSLEQMATA